MLPVGYLGPRPPVGSTRQTRLTQDEQRSLITLWSIMRSPLIMGGDLPHNDDWTTSLLTNPEVIEVDQHSTGNRPLMTTNGTTIWTARPQKGMGVYLAIFKRDEGKENVRLGWNEVGLVSGKEYRIRDLWGHKDLGRATSLNFPLRPHACVLFRVEE
jgi:hypothetical protein